MDGSSKEHVGLKREEEQDEDDDVDSLLETFSLCPGGCCIVDSEFDPDVCGYPNVSTCF